MHRAGAQGRSVATNNVVKAKHLAAKIWAAGSAPFEARLFAAELQALADAAQLGELSDAQRTRLTTMVEALKAVSERNVEEANDQLAMDAREQIRGIVSIAHEARRSGRTGVVDAAVMEIMRLARSGGDGLSGFGVIIDARTLNRARIRMSDGLDQLKSPSSITNEVTTTLLHRRGVGSDDVKQGAKRRGAHASWMAKKAARLARARLKRALKLKT